MIVNPRIGQRVELRYRPSLRQICPHGAKGTVVIVGTGKPRSHGVKLDRGEVLIVPCGHLFPEGVTQ